MGLRKGGSKLLNLISKKSATVAPKIEESLKKEIPQIEKTGIMSANELKSEAETLKKSNIDAIKKEKEDKELAEYIAKEIAPKQEASLKRAEKLEPALERLAKARATREMSGFENWAEGGEPTQALRDRLRREFEAGKTEGARDIDLTQLSKETSPFASKSQTAAKIGTAAAAAGLLIPTEAKGSTEDIQRALSKYEKYAPSEKELGEGIQTAAEWIAPYSKVRDLLTPTDTVSEDEEMAELNRLKKERALENLKTGSVLAKK